MNASGHRTGTPPKVIVIGAGFAGLAAARELETAGIEVVIHEARNRIGGRAWTDTRLGQPLEMGATWVHWHQPHVWSEITRYGAEIVASPFCDTAYWRTGDTVKKGTEDELDGLLARPMAKIFENSHEFFPQPYRPLAILDAGSSASEELKERFRQADAASVMDALCTDDFTPEERDLCDGYWSAGYIGNPYEGSALMAKQWAALCDNRLSLVDEQTLRFKLVDGMQQLYNGIAGDLNCPIHLNSPVSRVEHTDHSARITLESGATENADAVIVTVPVGALSTIEFSPPLRPDMCRVIEQKWNSTGAKIWIKVKGHHSILCYAPSPGPVTVMRSEYFTDDDATILVGFGPDHTAIDLENPNSARRILEVWDLPLEVIDCTGHDWVADKYSGQAWATLRKGQFIDGWSHFLDTASRLYFAGADWAKGWRGVVVDGALESGISQARAVIKEFQESQNS
ncbi:NAD(P)/FAD-dependent oxidoreductase [Corynebacterium sp. CCM 9204]|uniref:NAD(P)/FAD-dependent oxidoreductase n=1 Tax=Corynebacterium sp. CCM 9204 TaxID=3057616 RepID=UPI003524B2BC